MKEVHLVYNSISKNYIFYDGLEKSDKHRINLGIYDTSGLINELSHRLDLKRKTLLHAIDIPEDTLFILSNKLKGTKIRVVKETK